MENHKPKSCRRFKSQFLEKMHIFIFFYLSPWLGTNIVLEHFKKHNYEINYETTTKLATLMPHNPDIPWKLPFITSLGSQLAVMSDLTIYMYIHMIDNYC